MLASWPTRPWPSGTVVRLDIWRDRHHGGRSSTTASWSPAIHPPRRLGPHHSITTPPRPPRIVTCSADQQTSPAPRPPSARAIHSSQRSLQILLSPRRARHTLQPCLPACRSRPRLALSTSRPPKYSPACSEQHSSNTSLVVETLSAPRLIGCRCLSLNQTRLPSSVSL